MFTQIINEFITRLVEEFTQWLNSKLGRAMKTPPPPPLSATERSAMPQGHAPDTSNLSPAPQRDRGDGYER